MTALMLLSEWQESQVEFWRKIPGYEGLYDVSSFGRVRSWRAAGKVQHGNAAYWPSGIKESYRIMRPVSIQRGYLSMRFVSADGQRKGWLVHRLVALAFLLNSSNLPMVNHINNVKYDNRLANLEWVDHAGNVKHVMDNRIRVGGARSANIQITQEDIIAMRRLWARGWSLTQIGQEFGMSFQNASRIIRGEQWKYLEDVA